MFAHLFISRSSAGEIGSETCPSGKKAVYEQRGQASELKPDMPLPF